MNIVCILLSVCTFLVKYNVICQQTPSGISSVYGINGKQKVKVVPRVTSALYHHCSGDTRDLLLLRHKIRVMS